MQKLKSVVADKAASVVAACLPAWAYVYNKLIMDNSRWVMVHCMSQGARMHVKTLAHGQIAGMVHLHALRIRVPSQQVPGQTGCSDAHCTEGYNASACWLTPAANMHLSPLAFHSSSAHTTECLLLCTGMLRCTTCSFTSTCYNNSKHLKKLLPYPC